MALKMENRIKEYIDNYLNSNEKIAKEIKDLSKNYCISDFVKVQDTCKEYFETEKKSDIEGVYGCILNLDITITQQSIFHYLLI